MLESQVVGSWGASKGERRELESFSQARPLRAEAPFTRGPFSRGMAAQAGELGGNALPGDLCRGLTRSQAAWDVLPKRVSQKKSAAVIADAVSVFFEI